MDLFLIQASLGYGIGVNGFNNTEEDFTDAKLCIWTGNLLEIKAHSYIIRTQKTDRRNRAVVLYLLGRYDISVPIKGANQEPCRMGSGAFFKTKRKADTRMRFRKIKFKVRVRSKCSVRAGQCAVNPSRLYFQDIVRKRREPLTKSPTVLLQSAVSYRKRTVVIDDLVKLRCFITGRCGRCSILPRLLVDKLKSEFESYPAGIRICNSFRHLLGIIFKVTSCHTATPFL